MDYTITLTFYRIVRSAGTLGKVSAVWRITPMDNNTFQIVTDTVILTDGQQTATVTVPVSHNDMHDKYIK